MLLKYTMKIVVAGLMMSSLTGCDDPSNSAPTAQAWEVAGLEAPESALPDVAGDVIYVSNVNGAPDAKDGNGYISKVSLDGSLQTLKWVGGMDAPKGLARTGGKLFVSDIDTLVEIDIASGAVVKRYPAKDAKFLNDVAAAPTGDIYVSDMATNTIWRLSNGTFEPWLQDEALISPNGLYIDGEKLIVAAWGKMTDGFATKVPGHLLQVSLTDKSIRNLGSGKAVGNLDGIEPLDADTFLVTDWMSGMVFKISRNGDAKVLMPLEPGSADLGYISDRKLAIIPMMKSNKLIAIKVE
jgi:DNA-binding beta-propeller fold protein YncE